MPPSLKILSDENIELSLIKFLKKRGFGVKCAPKGMRNSELLSSATKEERILLTHDHDFLDTGLYPSVCGILVLGIHPPSIPKMETALLKFFEKFSAEEIKGKSFLLLEDRVEIFESENNP